MREREHEGGAMEDRDAGPDGSVDEDRRRLLAGLAALAASALAGPLRAQAPGVDLASLSKPLTGYTFADAATASAMLDALTEAVGENALRRIASIAAATPADRLAGELSAGGLAAQAEIVVAALFTGQVDTPKGTRVISYDNALVWQALAWTKPNAWCGGETGYWSAKPGNA